MRGNVQRESSLSAKSHFFTSALCFKSKRVKAECFVTKGFQMREKKKKIFFLPLKHIFTRENEPTRNGFFIFCK